MARRVAWAAVLSVFLSNEGLHAWKPLLGVSSSRPPRVVTLEGGPFPPDDDPLYAMPAMPTQKVPVMTTGDASSSRVVASGPRRAGGGLRGHVQAVRRRQQQQHQDVLIDERGSSSHMKELGGDDPVEETKFLEEEEGEEEEEEGFKRTFRSKFQEFCARGWIREAMRGGHLKIGELERVDAVEPTECEVDASGRKRRCSDVVRAVAKDVAWGKGPRPKLKLAEISAELVDLHSRVLSRGKLGSFVATVGIRGRDLDESQVWRDFVTKVLATKVLDRDKLYGSSFEEEEEDRYDARTTIGKDARVTVDFFSAKKASTPSTSVSFKLRAGEDGRLALREPDLSLGPDSKFAVPFLYETIGELYLSNVFVDATAVFRVANLEYDETRQMLVATVLAGERARVADKLLEATRHKFFTPQSSSSLRGSSSSSSSRERGTTAASLTQTTTSAEDAAKALLDDDIRFGRRRRANTKPPHLAPAPWSRRRRSSSPTAVSGATSSSPAAPIGTPERRLPRAMGADDDVRAASAPRTSRHEATSSSSSSFAGSWFSTTSRRRRQVNSSEDVQHASYDSSTPAFSQTSSSSDVTWPFLSSLMPRDLRPTFTVGHRLPWVLNAKNAAPPAVLFAFATIAIVIHLAALQDDLLNLLVLLFNRVVRLAAATLSSLAAAFVDFLPRGLHALWNHVANTATPIVNLLATQLPALLVSLAPGRSRSSSSSSWKQKRSHSSTGRRAKTTTGPRRRRRLVRLAGQLARTTTTRLFSAASRRATQPHGADAALLCRDSTNRGRGPRFLEWARLGRARVSSSADCGGGQAAPAAMAAAGARL